MKLHLFIKLGIIIGFLFFGWNTSLSQTTNNESTQPNDTTSDAGVKDIPGIQLLLTNDTTLLGTVNRADGSTPADLVDFWNLPDTSDWPFHTNVSGVLRLEQNATANVEMTLVEYNDAARSVFSEDSLIVQQSNFTIGNLNRNKYYSIKIVFVDKGQLGPPVEFLGTYSLRFSLTAGAGSGSGSIGLPVEWLSFETERLGQSIHITWSTAIESNNQGFYVERSSDAETWESIGFVEGTGNSDNIQLYSFVDDFPNIGYNYYRLKQVDFDGATDYSEIREVVLDPGTFVDALTVFPNPVKDFLTITPVIGKLNVRDLSGRSMYTSTLNGTRTQVSMQDFPSGIYLVEIQPYNQSRKVFRVVH